MQMHYSYMHMYRTSLGDLVLEQLVEEVETCQKKSL